jgi:hypothetical protein
MIKTINQTRQRKENQIYYFNIQRKVNRMLIINLIKGKALLMSKCLNMSVGLVTKVNSIWLQAMIRLKNRIKKIAIKDKIVFKSLEIIFAKILFN